MERTSKIKRRDLLIAMGSIGAAAVLAACTQPPAPAAPTNPPSGQANNPPAAGATPAATATKGASTGTAAPTNTPAAAKTAVPPTPTPGTYNFGQLKDIPRSKTLIHAGTGGETPNQFTDTSFFNPYLPGTTRSGIQFMFEPLWFFNAYATKDNTVKWIGDSYKYNQDFTEVDVKIMKGVEWSDGQPFTAKDIAYTLTMLRDNAPDLGGWSNEMKIWVKDAVATDDQTVHITLNKPNPRFVFRYFTVHFDIGLYIVPEHIFKGQDVKTFTFFDVQKGWPITNSPYKLVVSSPEQKIWDRRDDWWAAKINYKPLPAVERIIFIPGSDESKLVQLEIANQIDTSLTLTANNIKAILDQNPKVDTWSGKDAPYGYRDWWPGGLSFNCSQAPYNDANVRWAINRAINRDQLIQVAYKGAGYKNVHPWPQFPAMQKFTDAVQPIVQKYQVDKQDLAEVASRMQKAGYTKDGQGFWTKDGKRFSMVVETFNVWQDITVVLVEQLKKAGFDASFKMVPDFFSRLPLGQLDAFVFGHGGGVSDPFATLDLYHSRNFKPTGESTGDYYRWVNKDFDALVDQMSIITGDDPKFIDLLTKAMDIWYGDLPDIMLVELIHRNPRNNTYWTNWPSKDNPYINDANWHRIFELYLTQLKPVQA